jgi:glutathione synthase/RimK-type ligase-like ATP-grasp enzyme
MIVIVDQIADYHARVVAHCIEKRGESVFFADIRELGSGGELSFWPDAPERTEWRRRDGTAARLGDAGAIWFRRLYPPETPIDVGDAEDRAFIAREWASMVRGVFAALDVPTINPIYPMVRATKPYQLALARRAGLAVPDTVITSSRRRALEFVAGPGPSLHKVITAPQGRFLATQLWDDRDAGHLDELELAPTIFQKRVGGTRELRITAVGEQLFAAEYRTALVDGRTDMAAPYVRHQLPVSVACGLLSLLDRLGLPFATIDMRIDEQGEYWFLEANNAGQFLWIEIRTGMPISRAVADLLCESARRHRQRPATRARRQVGASARQGIR